MFYDFELSEHLIKKYFFDEVNVDSATIELVIFYLKYKKRLIVIDFMAFEN